MKGMDTVLEHDDIGVIDEIVWFNTGNVDGCKVDPCADRLGVVVSRERSCESSRGRREQRQSDERRRHGVSWSKKANDCASTHRPF